MGLHTRFTSASAVRPERAAWSERTKLIWHPDEVETHFEQPKNAFCHFRKTFEAPADRTDARIRMFADSRYRLSVNGRYVGRGPCRSDPRWQYYDEFDEAPFLQPGSNVIAVLVLHYGYGTGQSIHRMDPGPCGLDDVRARLPVNGGELGMRLSRIDAGRWTLNVSIPPGYAGTIGGATYEAGEHTVTIGKGTRAE